MKYFLPEWDDLVDPDYDFLEDKYSKGHSKDNWGHDSYIWHVYGECGAPLDGVLVSRVKIHENKWKEEQILNRGVHDFLRLPRSIPVMCDCGAWGYINKEKPDFKTRELLEYYLKGRFDIGVSIDHLIVESIQKEGESVPLSGARAKKPQMEARPLTQKEKQERWQITVDNAREMMKIWSSEEKYRSSFRIMGAIQGWDVLSYRRAAREVLEAGYDYIGIGGVARSPTGNADEAGQTKTVVNVARGVCYEVRKWAEERKGRVDVHIFGFARPDVVEFLMRLGVTSFDSASALRSAWLGSFNYFIDEKKYTAIRIPDTMRSARAKRKLKGSTEADGAELKAAERQAMEKLRKYDRGQAKASEVLEFAKRHGQTMGVKPHHLEQYGRTLADKPWKMCRCAICRNLGIEVVIFRGNERNRRRGFHNTFVFYKNFRKKAPRALAFTMCTGKKDTSQDLIPAYRRYLPSPPFRAFWNAVYGLPVDVKILSAKYGLIDWSTPIPNYDKKMTKVDAERFVSKLEIALQNYDRVFFIGLGLYKQVVEEVRGRIATPIEVYPKSEYTSRPLDILEYSGQMAKFREGVVRFVGAPMSLKELAHLGKYASPYQHKMSRYI